MQIRTRARLPHGPPRVKSEGTAPLSTLPEVILVFVLLASAAPAAPPLNPLPSPYYSFDLSSPSVSNNDVNANDILSLSLPYPVTLISAAALGLAAAGDDMDGLSGGNFLISPESSFSIRFSVTRESTGDTPPAIELVELGTPYNVKDQATRGQQAGDEFLSLDQFSLLQPMARGEAGLENNTLIKNNYDEGGSDYAARPETHANSMVSGLPQDNVDALANFEPGEAIFYSATAASPSLLTLPGSENPSGASIFRLDQGTISLYASYAALGLQQDDDIDAIVVFDTDANGEFSGDDRVLFSLTPDSPSLAAVPGAGVNAAADVFIAAPGEAVALFTSAARLGLTGETDDIDALEILPNVESRLQTVSHAIRSILGDFDDDADVDQQDLDSFNHCFGGEGQPYSPGCERGDFDSDGDIDCRDSTKFVMAWTAPGPAGVPSQCRATIPTVSEWGALVLGLTIAVVGSLLVYQGRRRTC